ncbi:hypothetical protein KPH14_011982 [Odynerus spinipes]|uniref:Uncharacterized protein n=1 Tax=Odynerus spinipes TaxID=1348599 RepID=A0AAD9VKG5_9HYME|nr:hypothetical protein KPH14_011982 [Odynerus spinipes]
MGRSVSRMVITRGFFFLLRGSQQEDAMLARTRTETQLLRRNSFERIKVGTIDISSNSVFLPSVSRARATKLLFDSAETKPREDSSSSSHRHSTREYLQKEYRVSSYPRKAIMISHKNLEVQRGIRDYEGLVLNYFYLTPCQQPY